MQTLRRIDHTMGFPFKVIGKLQKGGAGKRRFFLAPRLAVLVSLSTVLLASSAVIYASAVPDLMYRSPAVAAAVSAAQEAETAISEGVSSVFSSPSAAQTSADAPAAAETAVSAASPEESPQASSAAAAQSQGPESPSATGSSSNGSSAGEVVVEDDSLSEAEEQQWRSYYIALYNNLSDCVSRYNECSSELGSLTNASESERQRAAKRCDVLSSDLLDGYLKACNSGIPSSSRYASFSDSQTGAYRSLASALACIQEAWEVNLASEDPSTCTAKMNEKLAPQAARLAEFNAYYAKSCPA